MRRKEEEKDEEATKGDALTVGPNRTTACFDHETPPPLGDGGGGRLDGERSNYANNVVGVHRLKPVVPVSHGKM